MNTIYDTSRPAEHAPASMRFNHFLMTGLGEPHPWSANHTPVLTASAADLLFGMGMTCIEITFDGHTRTYTDLGVCRFTEGGTTQLWYLDAGLGNGDYLSIGLLGNGSGSYSFGTDLSERTGISIVTYGIGQSIYSSYYAHSPKTDKPCLTQGRVDVELPDCSRLARLTFSGTVLPMDRTDGLGQAVPISGRLCLAC
ncbi:hypothetical protein [Spirosoma validum]|uniref:Uncharacterized protein n=1 Tax=Spirosoma validum TaxID=2771355 RepID=A0A927B4R8_9BACT|nr:hypothetical protein [Spirosoma validum]MBD2755630.1 hypothetical protein [Spirosoma validum]